MLISHCADLFRESETDCAHRFRSSYSLSRALDLCQVFIVTAPARVFEAYWRGVFAVLCQYLEPKASQAHLASERARAWNRTHEIRLNAPPNKKIKRQLKAHIKRLQKDKRNKRKAQA